MAFPSVTYSITNGTPNDGSQVAQNFSDCINAMKDGTKDFSISALTVGAIFTLSSTISSALTPTTNTFYDIGSATKGWSSLYLGGSSTFTIKLAAPVLAASYTLTLPSAVPTQTFPLYMTSTGALQVQSSKGQQLSSSSGNYTLTSTSETDVTNLSVSITTTGRPVMMMLIPDGSFTGDSYIGASNGAGIAGTYYGLFYFERDGSNIALVDFGGTIPASALVRCPPSALAYMDTPAAGTYTYKVAVKGTTGTTVYVQYCKLLVYEL